MRNMYAMARVMFVMALLAGCAQLGLPTAQTFSEKLSAGYAAVTAVNNNAALLLETKKITSADAMHILEQTKNARMGLDVARNMAAVDPKSADSKVDAIRIALQAASAYLAKKGT